MDTTIGKIQGVTIQGAMNPDYESVLSPEALQFVATLQRRFNERRGSLLEQRELRSKSLGENRPISFPEATASIREGQWQVGQVPADLQDRRVEITGPVDRKMVINALNSGAKVFMADFEDANSPTWANCVEGQINLRDAIRGEIDFTADNGKHYSLNPTTAVLKVRPRGWHLEEKHVLVDGQPISASIFDFGIFFFTNAAYLVDKGTGPYFYLPKLEGYEEAALWNEVFEVAQGLLGVPMGTVKVTVLIETITAALEMEEILYSLKDHIVALNAGRWDYIFSVIKNFNGDILPDRGQVTMDVPFMAAYARQLVKVCHKRGAHAIGGMAAFIPSKDPDVNEQAFEKVKQDKEREAGIGYDGTWVAHPKLVEVAKGVFDSVLGEAPHQKGELCDSLSVTAEDLTDFTVKGGRVTEAGIRQNINVAILYIASWLRGTGAAALYNLMEDAATAEISRAQVWQWLHHNITLDDTGEVFNEGLYDQLLEEEVECIKAMVGRESYEQGRYVEAVRLFDELVVHPRLKSFLTLEAYPLI